MEQLTVVKIGGNIIDDAAKLALFLKQFAQIEGRKILVHGGGKLATKLAEKLGIQQQMVDGRRITDAETLQVVTMVYAGLINKQIVASLQSMECNAVGVTGADGNLITAHKREHATIDFGFVGDVDAVNTQFLQLLLQQNLLVVIAPITQNKAAQLLNTNADTIAQEIAKSMGHLYEVNLVYSFEKEGVLLDANNDATVIAQLNKTYYTELKNNNIIFAGMLPKLDNAFKALENGVSKVIIGKAEKLHELLNGSAGTTIHINN
ncbi:MAG: acetylglutamate kinase [Chitinophagaceae bacterium]